MVPHYINRQNFEEGLIDDTSPLRGSAHALVLNSSYMGQIGYEEREGTSSTCMYLRLDRLKQQVIAE